MRTFVLLPLLATAPSLLASCASAGTPRSSAAATQAEHEVGPRPPTRADRSVAPHPMDSLSAEQASLVAHCGKPDAVLFAVATDLVREAADGHVLPGTEEIGARLRDAGAPYVWPAATKVAGPATDADLVERMTALGRQIKGDGESRCGYAVHDLGGGNRVLIALGVSTLGRFEPLPRQVAPGQWLTATATFPTPLRSASAYLLGPSQSPKSVQSTLDSSRKRLSVKFSPETDGAYLLQLLGDVGNGPRPLFEASVLAGKVDAKAAAAPALHAASDDEKGVLQRMNELRATQKAAPLVLDAALSKLAAEHAKAMSDKQKLAHDVGHGNPDARVRRAGIVLKMVGENVSYAKGVIAAHEGIERSPSHRANVLRAEFTKVGIGFVRQADGFVYLAEIFGS